MSTWGEVRCHNDNFKVKVRGASKEVKRKMGYLKPETVIPHTRLK